MFSELRRKKNLHLHDMLPGLCEYSNRPTFTESQCYKWKMMLSLTGQKSQGKVSSGAKAVGSGVKEAVSSLKE